MFILIPIITAVIFGYIVAYSIKSDRPIGKNLIAALVGALIIRSLTYLISLSINTKVKNDILIAVISSVLGAILFTYVYNLSPTITLDEDDEA